MYLPKEKQLDIVTSLVDRGHEVQRQLTVLQGLIGEKREKFHDLTIQHGNQKKKYDAALFHVEQEAAPLAQEIKGYHDEMRKHSSKLYELDILKRHLDILLAKTQREMKAYIGSSSEPDEFLQSKNSKTYRDYYQKKLHELELQVRGHSERLQDVKDSFDFKSRERDIMIQLKSLFEIKGQALVEELELEQAESEQNFQNSDNFNATRGDRMILQL